MAVTAASTISNPDFQEKHSLWIDASLEDTWLRLRGMDIYDSKLIRFLFFLRGLRLDNKIDRTHRNWSDGWNRLFNSGFAPISIVQNKSIVMRLNEKIIPNKNKKNQINIVWDFVLTPHNQGTVVTTETRVLFRSRRYRNFFLPYWLIVRLPSGAIRREMLRLVKKSSS
ncbi:MAG: hypothetical protein GPJ54_15555 [Candidatus Heimdallarchaeota archaeon]|nr:hypothetical protein [Candidatus Heimdallarchaeota archaeon]